MTAFTINASVTVNPGQWAAQGYGGVVDLQTMHTYMMHTLGKDHVTVEGGPELTIVIMNSRDNYTFGITTNIVSPVATLGFGTRTDSQEAESVFRHAVQDFSRVLNFVIQEAA